jgi:hypothetical protein
MSNLEEGLQFFVVEKAERSARWNTSSRWNKRCVAVMHHGRKKLADRRREEIKCFQLNLSFDAKFLK